MRLLSWLVLALVATFGRPAAASPPPKIAESTLTNGSFTETIGGRQIHYEVHGQGPVLMALTNSWGLSHQALRAMYRPLEERLTLVYFDPRGMGASGPATKEGDRGLTAVREDFNALREHLALDKVNAIGWSNGAINLIYLAAERPEALSSAIFVHGMASAGPEDMQEVETSHPDLVRQYTEFMKQVSDPGLSDDEKTRLQRQLWLDEYFPALCAEPARGRAIVSQVFAEAQLSWPHAMQTEKEVGVFDARDKLPGIPVRSLVIAGRHDLLPPSKVKVLADGLPSSKFVVFERSGHFSPIEEPGAFRAAVFEFLGVADHSGPVPEEGR